MLSNQGLGLDGLHLENLGGHDRHKGGENQSGPHYLKPYSS